MLVKGKEVWAVLHYLREKLLSGFNFNFFADLGNSNPTHNK